MWRAGLVCGAAVLGSAVTVSALCAESCAVPALASDAFCRRVATYRACPTAMGFVAIDGMAREWAANASKVAGCDVTALERAACLGMFEACEFGRDTRTLCRPACETAAQACGRPEGACEANGMFTSEGAQCVGIDYQGMLAVATVASAAGSDG